MLGEEISPEGGDICKGQESDRKYFMSVNGERAWQKLRARRCDAQDVEESAVIRVKRQGRKSQVLIIRRKIIRLFFIPPR